MTGIEGLNGQGGILGMEGGQHARKGVCARCEGAVGSHEAEARRWHGKSTGELKG